MTKTQIINNFNKEFTQADETGQPNNWKHDGASAKKIRAFLEVEMSLFEKAIREETLQEVEECVWHEGDIECACYMMGFKAGELQNKKA